MQTEARALVRRQLELEDESRGLGATRYRAARPLPWKGDASSVSEETALPPGKMLLKQCIEPVEQAVAEWCAQIANGGAGRRHGAFRLLNACLPDQVAYLTARVVINSVSSRLGLTATAFAVAAALIEHIEMVRLKETNKKGYRGLTKVSKKKASDHKWRQALKKIMDAEGTRLTVPQAEQLQVGLKAIELMCDSTGLFVIEQPAGRGNSRIVRATETLVDWLDKQHARCELLEPIHMPMIVRPRRWRTPFWGGYLTKRPGLRLVKQWQNAYHSELRHVDMPLVYKAVNTIQESPWRISSRILDLMTQVWEDGGNLGGLPQREDEPVPAKPEDFDVNDEARSVWFREAAKVHEANAFMQSKRLQLSQRLWIANKFRDEEAIYFPHELDFRGRVYPVPTGGPHPQGDDAAKALLEFSEGMPIGETGGMWLTIHVANLFGVDKVSFSDRIKWVAENAAAIIDSGENPLDGGRFWTTADSPWCALAACIDYAGYCRDGAAHISHIPVALDGSNSGLQHFSAMLRDPVGAAAVNLLPSDKPQDVYMQVAVKAQAIVDATPVITIKVKGKDGEDKEIEVANPWMNGKVTRAIAKRPTMTYCYSATRFGMVDMIHQTLREIDADKGQPHLGGFDNYQAASYLSYVVWDAISQVVVAATGAMGWLREVAKVATKATVPVWWTTPTGLPVLQMYTNMEGREIDVHIGGARTKLVIKTPSAETTLNSNGQANGIAPNFVHSFDGAHLQSVANGCNDAGIKSIAVIHDSFGTHAARTGELADILRQTFIDQYTPNVLQRFYEEISEQLPEEFVEQLPPPPAEGLMDLQDMAAADYMFA
ncbi:T3/T7 RNA polymerase [Novosphingobium umbonatum]|uniref:DNA-directed RNA polymerase n=1 Tax=Novosphingobium umbonatum TaxID=1908524 RepID=A0A437N0Y5_9SPHN|nr:DNA-directed RNA polymerase [Novosphingobium umbonatum]RVU03582.1 T3/T7 RNA polymerase [Novosphingobium umbonatum]